MEARRWQGRAERREAVGSSAQGSIATLAQGSAAWQNGKQSRMGGKEQALLDRSSRNMAAGGGPKHNTEQ